MNRSEGLVFLKENLKNENLVKHSLAVEKGMMALAIYFQEDACSWGLAGLLHDIDYEQTKNQPEKHSLLGAEMVYSRGLSKEIVEAIKSHNAIHGIGLQSLMGRALFCLDPLTGLVVAATLVLPSRKIADLTVESAVNRFGEKSFARGANRDTIAHCQDYLGLSLSEFISIILPAMQEISDELGL